MVLKKLGPAAGQDVELPWDSIKEALDHMAESSANYVDKEHLLVLWDSLQVRISTSSLSDKPYNIDFAIIINVLCGIM